MCRLIDIGPTVWLVNTEAILNSLGCRQDLWWNVNAVPQRHLQHKTTLEQYTINDPKVGNDPLVLVKSTIARTITEIPYKQW